MTDKPSVLRETDDEARHLARTLLRGARYGAIAVIDPQTGFPSASRVLLATDHDGVPAILVSELSAHTKALTQDARCSLLTGEPGKGDPLAHPRLTVQCLAERLEAGTPERARLRQRFLNRHPKAALYIDFPDFRLFRLVPQTASLNGGFGRAYVLPGADLVIPADEKSATFDESETLQLLEATAPGLAAAVATGLCRAKAGDWRFSGADRAGLDISGRDLLIRYEFPHLLNAATDVVAHICGETNKEHPIP